MRDPDPKARQLDDLARALTRRRGERRWGMFVDMHRCTGCRACQVSCEAENNTPPAVTYMMVLEESHGTFPHTRRSYRPKPCMHCATPACVLVCPVGATYATPDGTVVMDYMKCIGCRYCMTACPYSARTFDVGDRYGEGCQGEVAYERRPSPDYARAWPREHHDSPIGNVRKCHHCLHRLSRGSLPACVATCPTSALVFGDLNDPYSLAQESISRHGSHRLKEELGNEPMVYYRS